MCQRGNGSADCVESMDIERDGFSLLLVVEAGEDITPGADDHAVAVTGNAGVRIGAALVGRNDKALIFDGPGPEQYFPMVLAGALGEV